MAHIHHDPVRGHRAAEIVASDNVSRLRNNNPPSLDFQDRRLARLRRAAQRACDLSGAEYLHRADQLVAGFRPIGEIFENVLADLTAGLDRTSDDKRRRIDVRLLPRIMRIWRRLSPAAQRRALELMIDGRDD